jgi:hypothetical protein
MLKIVLASTETWKIVFAEGDTLDLIVDHLREGGWEACSNPGRKNQIFIFLTKRGRVV